MYKKTLVTGGCGFISSYLVNRLLNEGLEASSKNNGKTRKKIPSIYRIDGQLKGLYDEFKKIKNM